MPTFDSGPRSDERTIDADFVVHEEASATESSQPEPVAAVIEPPLTWRELTVDALSGAMRDWPTWGTVFCAVFMAGCSILGVGMWRVSMSIACITTAASFVRSFRGEYRLSRVVDQARRQI